MTAHSEPTEADKATVLAEVTEWIRQYGLPLSTADAKEPLRDIEPIGDMVGDADVVGIGPSTYGGHEQFTQAHRIIQILVERLGFRTVATEEDWDVARELDHYVLTGEGDLDTLVKGTGVPWRVGEVRDLLAWIRQYNISHDDDPVRFVGVGVIDTRPASYAEVSAYVEATAPDRLAELAGHFDVIRPTRPNHVRWFISEVTDKDRYVEHARAAAALVTSLSGPDAHQQAWIAQQARQIVGFYEHYAHHLTDDGYRDEKMAENLVWWHKHTGHRIAYLSTSAHSVRSDGLTINVPPRGTLTFKPTGGHLREAFGDKYFSIGITFTHGTVNSGWGLPPFSSGPIAAPTLANGFVEPAFHNYASPRYLLDLRRGAPQIVRDWLASPVKARIIGSICAADQPPEGYYMTGGSLAEWYDVLLHEKELTPTQVK
ncbi:erythromycin esterase family protein [Actinophytocola sediminis]